MLVSEMVQFISPTAETFESKTGCWEEQLMRCGLCKPGLSWESQDGGQPHFRKIKGFGAWTCVLAYFSLLSSIHSFSHVRLFATP